MWNIETLVDGTWRKVSPSTFGNERTRPYTFDTERDALEMSKLCYDGDASVVRVVNACKHGLGFPYAGTVPCTGPRRCPLCGQVQ